MTKLSGVPITELLIEILLTQFQQPLQPIKIYLHYTLCSNRSYGGIGIRVLILCMFYLIELKYFVKQHSSISK